MARKTPLIAPGSVLTAREDPPNESVMEDVLGSHKRRKGIEPPQEETTPDESESFNVRKYESKNERNIERNQESLNARMNEDSMEGLIEAAALHSIRPGADLTPWGTRLPRGLKKRLDYQAFRLKEHKVTGQGLTIFALEKLLAELEAQEQEEG